MNFEYFIGIDCSKSTLDYALIDAAGHTLDNGVIDNKPKAIKALFKQVLKYIGCTVENLLICAENTGLYSNYLKVVATDEEYKLWCQDALELKLSSGKQKDKTDAQDALVIARYARRYEDQVQLFTMPNQTVLQVKEISRKRQRLVQDKTAWEVRLQEQNEFGLAKNISSVSRLFKKHVRQIDKLIKEIDVILTQLIKSDEDLKRKYDITRSVPGFGPKNTISIMAETEAYEKTPNGKACASYAGLCPYKYQSGTSVKRSSRTLKACNKRLKTAIHLGAMSLIKHDNIYRHLYDRLRAKGRRHLQAVNAVRNKMVTVLFACLRDNVMYKKNLHKCLDTP